MQKQLISHEALLQIVDYCPETGQLFRIGRFSRNGRLIPIEGPRKPTGSITRRDGYIQLTVDGRVYSGHRLAWFFVHGEWPTVIDHINGDPADNRIANLRNCTQAENTQNLRAARSHNKTGLLGVSFDRERGKYLANITVAGKRRTIGRFETPEEAHRAYVQAKRSAHSHATI